MRSTSLAPLAYSTNVTAIEGECVVRCVCVSVHARVCSVERGGGETLFILLDVGSRQMQVWKVIR